VFPRLEEILVAATLALAADRLPSFRIEAHCRDVASRAAPVGDVGICLRKEWAARDQLIRQWARLPRSDRTHCVELVKGEPTYTGLLTCLELAEQARQLRDPGRGTTGEAGR
jgi:hypothetical protein